jgi:hypothetical protein
VVCIVCFGLLCLLAWSYAYKFSSLDPDDLIHQDLVFSGLDRIEIVNVSHAGLWLNIQGRVGVVPGR